MVKQHINLYIDSEVVELAKENFKNLSGFIEGLLKDALITKKPETKQMFDVLKAKEGAKEQLTQIKKEIAKMEKKREEVKKPVVIDRYQM